MKEKFKILNFKQNKIAGKVLDTGLIAISAGISFFDIQAEESIASACCLINHSEIFISDLSGV